MGYFFACTALRSSDPQGVLEEIVRFSQANSCPAQIVEQKAASTYTEKTDALVFVPTGGWVIILWPEYFNVCDTPMVLHLSSKLQALATSIHCYDGEYWAHLLIDKGTILDRFASIPDYFAESEAEAVESRRAWKGNPDLIAKIFGVSASAIAPYLVHLDPEAPPARKAMMEDEFELDNWWVFTDFWKRLGIEYPGDMGSFKFIVRLGADFMKKLPQTTESL